MEYAVTAAIRPGATFAGYQVESLVGRGGMGVVYRATDLSLQRPVSVQDLGRSGQPTRTV
jgi:serine/threonine protein kinase